MSALWNSLMKSAHVVCRVLMRAMPLLIGNCWIASRMSLVMSETSVRSSELSENEVLNTFMPYILRGASREFSPAHACRRGARPNVTIMAPLHDCQIDGHPSILTLSGGPTGPAIHRPRGSGRAL